VDRMRESAERNRRATMRTLRHAFLSSAALEFIATISVALVAVSIGLRLVSGSLDLGTGLVVLILAPEAYWPLRQVGAQFHASAEGLAAAESMIAVIEEAGSKDHSPTVDTIDLARTTLRIEGLTVQYDRDRPALAGVDLVVRPGEYVSVAGPSGCGKTTLLLTLLGFVTPSSGRIVLDGPHGPVDLADVSPDGWRAQIAWVPQEPWLAAASIADNVRLARPDASPAAVDRAIRMAHATEFVERLADGSATVLGENGTELSAGQRQRIALARAFLRDAPLVLLDEPTAHLDPVSEAAVARAVRLLARNRAVIAVAHRPALLAAGDRVVHLTPWPERASA
jgi:ABC-type transport system involved in cytochrome bd biosynthesis fused ATPase/permease subunit